MLEIDGSAGGGQLLRTALALAAVTDRPVTVTNVRGSRPEPGLEHQHLTAVEVLAEACNAELDGAALGSERVVFRPGTPRGGRIEADVGTAGSVTLVFDALLPLGVVLDEPLAVTVRGGTAVKWSPPAASYRQVKLPLCRQLGLSVAVDRHRSGYYPAGGGAATLQVGPSSLSALALGARGELRGARIHSAATWELTENAVARRQAEAAQTRLEEAGVDVLERRVVSTAAESPGSALTVELVFESSRAGFDALGEPGTPAEQVGAEPAAAAVEFLEGAACVDSHLGDQLLVFLALAGGRLRIPERTDHVETSLDLLERFGVETSVVAACEAVEISASA